MKKLIRNGIEGLFSDADWESGQPQRYGWQEQGKEKKELPKEILQFIHRRRPEEKSDFATGGIVTGEQKVESQGGEKVVPIPKVELVPAKIKTVKKPKKETDDNPKQKDGGTAKRKPRRVEKN